MKALTVLCVLAAASTAYAGEADKKNPWDRFNKPSNVFNTAKPVEPEPGCRDLKNCLGRNLMPAEKPSPKKPVPARKAGTSH